jgi:hypothetical protein
VSSQRVEEQYISPCLSLELNFSLFDSPLPACVGEGLGVRGMYYSSDSASSAAWKRELREIAWLNAVLASLI